MAKKQARKRQAPWLNQTLLKRVLTAVGLTITLVTALIVHDMIEEFLIEDARFALQKPEISGDLSPSIHLSGVEHSSLPHIRKIFNDDGGRSLYEFPADKRRITLLAVDWVRTASVARIWPNEVEVTVEERTPVAYVRLKAGRSGGRRRLVLIDIDGVLLEKPARSQIDLPVLTGVREEQEEEVRADQIRLVMRMVGEIGELESGLSEINVSEPHNVKVTQDMGAQSVVLYLGRERFRPRLTNFLNHYPEIHRRQPRSVTFDLRIDDRITALDGVDKDE